MSCNYYFRCNSPDVIESIKEILNGFDYVFDVRESNMKVTIPLVKGIFPDIHRELYNLPDYDYLVVDITDIDDPGCIQQ